MWMKAILAMASLNVAATGMSQAEVPEPKAWIDAADVENTLQLRGFVMSDAEEEFSYKLTVERQGKSGVSKTSQGGKVTSKVGEPTVLSTTRFNRVSGSVLKATLEVTNSSGEVTTDVFVDPAN